MELWLIIITFISIIAAIKAELNTHQRLLNHDYSTAAIRCTTK